jgi:hypothetical protein
MLCHNSAAIYTDSGGFRWKLIFISFPWLTVGPLHVDIGARLDALSLMMLLIVTGVGSAIHIYSFGYMRDDSGFSRFFASMSLFMFSMIGICVYFWLGIRFGWMRESPVSYWLLVGGIVGGMNGVALQFRHEIARLAVEGAVTAHRRSAIYARILASLRALGCGDDARMAFYAEAAGDGPVALRHASAAARRAVALASHREAAAQFERALRFTDGADPATVAGLHDGFAYEASLLDHWQEAADASERARRLDAARPFMDRYQAIGYRAPSLLRTRELVRDVAERFLYDSSIPTSGGLFPVPNSGCATARPFIVEGAIELPVTLPRDGSLRFLDYSPAEIFEMWTTCANAIARSGGIVVLLTHCEARFSGNREMLRLYARFIEFIVKESARFAFSTPPALLPRIRASS